MHSRLGRAFADWWGPVPNFPGRRGRPLGLSLEVLEPRLLMARFGDSVVALRQIPVPAVRPILVESPSRSTPVGGSAAVEAQVGDEGGDDDDDYGGTPDITGLAPPIPGTYVIVPETPSPHSTLQTAQPIPDVPYAGVVGVIGLGDPIDLYRIAVGPGALVLRLGSTSNGSSSSPSLRLLVFDALGRLLADATSVDGPVDLSLNPGQIGLLPGSALYVGVASVGAISPAALGGYQLWFLRLNGAGADSSTPDAPSFTALSALGPSFTPPLASTVLPGSPARPLSPDLIAAPPSLVASAQLPTLSAAPSGGVMADDAPSVAVALREPAGIEPAPPGDPAQPSKPERKDLALQGDEAAQEGEAPPMVMLRAPGGFPLLAAATVGDWRVAKAVATDPEAAAEHALSGCQSSPSRAAGVSPVPAGVLPLTILGPQLLTRPRGVLELPRRPALVLAAAGTVYAFFTDRTLFDDLNDLSTALDRSRRRRCFWRRLRGPKLASSRTRLQARSRARNTGRSGPSDSKE